jgi:hypothetical protein
MSYTKLFSHIITSSIWSEDSDTKVVWVTMLALANKHGEVMASIPGLAKVAGISIEGTQKAIQKFLSPDVFSRTKEAEGRRIEEIDGGWFIINYIKHREMASAEDERIKNVERQRRFRSRHGSNAEVTPRNGDVTPRIDNAEADAEADAEENTHSRKRESGSVFGFDDFWAAYPNKKAKGDAKKAWLSTKASNHLPAILSGIAASRRSEQWRKDGGRFIPHPGKWLRSQGWEDSHEPIQARETVPMVVGENDLTFDKWKEQA